jgi:hypothetical protein
MGDTISGVMSSLLSGNLNAALKQSQQNQGGRSFENVLRDTPGNSLNQSATGQQTGVSGAQLEQMRVELAQRIGRIPPGTSKINALLPEFIDSRTRMGLLKEAMASVGTNRRAEIDLHGRFAQVENEWSQIESIMRSNQDLSTGQLLGLQARLYQVSQHVEVMSKVVDQVTGGIKTILNTNV